MIPRRVLLAAALGAVLSASINGCSDDYAPDPSMEGYWIGENATVDLRISISERAYTGWPSGYLAGAGRIVMKETGDTLYIVEASVYDASGVSLGFMPDSLPYRSFYGTFKTANEVQGSLSRQPLFLPVEASIPITLRRQ